jgi:hypothetical protein
MSSIQTSQHVLIARRSGDRRMEDRRKRNNPVGVERRTGQERRRLGERRQHDLYAPSCAHADRLCSALAQVPADQPIVRLLVVQSFLLGHRPRQDNAWIMRWARHLRAAYCDSDRDGMRRAVFCALYGDKARP